VSAPVPCTRITCSASSEEDIACETRYTFLRVGRPIMRHLAPHVKPEQMKEEHPIPLPQALRITILIVPSPFAHDDRPHPARGTRLLISFSVLYVNVARDILNHRLSI
jgi:hypothetical protein